MKEGTPERKLVFILEFLHSCQSARGRGRDGRSQSLRDHEGSKSRAKLATGEKRLSELLMRNQINFAELFIFLQLKI